MLHQKRKRTLETSSISILATMRKKRKPLERNANVTNLPSTDKSSHTAFERDLRGFVFKPKVNNTRLYMDILRVLWREKAVRWYRTITSGDGDLSPRTQFRLGLCYEYGSGGVQEDAQEAIRWYRMSAEQGHAPAQYSLGFCSEYGIGVAEDAQEAVHWYRMAAQHGHMEAQSSLGFCYKQGTGVQKNDVEALRWFRMSANQGFAEAQYNVGVYYEDGNGGLIQNKDEAMHWYRMAAAQGHTVAASALSFLS